MEQNRSSEANGHAASEEIPRLLLNLKVHHRVHKILPLVCILNHMHLVHNFPPSFEYYPPIYA